VDLPQEYVRGLVDVQGRLASIKGIKFIRLTVRDIVRHRLVRDIVNAYQKETAPEAEAEQHPGQGQPDEDDSDA
jgi:phosphate starvation-inducible PhoH-like protein